jgi:hypothetical protein
MESEEECKVEKLNIQPPAAVYGTFARYNYKMWYAIAEFVDNSTASFFKNEASLKFIKEDALKIDISYDSLARTLTITDNAYGMEINDFKRAILLDSKPETNDGRNEFGMGLKTAASWFGKKWSVFSTQYCSTNAYHTTVDIPFLEKTKTNDVNIITTPAASGDHKTIIKIEELNRSIDGPKTIAKIKDVLRSMYRRDLATGKITIFYNGDSLHFKPYQVLTYKDKEWRKNVDFYFNFDHILHHVSGFVGLLGPEDSGFKKAGFALFRRNRVVIGSEGEYYKPQGIFGEAQSKISHKLFGELDLEDFQINQAKDGFVWDDGLEEEFVKQLKEQIEDYIRLADKTVKERENTFDPKDTKQIEETKNETQSKLNELFERTDSGNAPAATESQEDGQEREFENIFGSDSPDLPERVYEETATNYQVPNGRNSETVKVTWTDAGSAYWFSCDPQTNNIKINISHPFFKPFCASEDFRNVINKFVIALIIAERKANDGSQKSPREIVGDINNNINNLLKDLSK